jgi:hypothetical protein
VRTIGVSNFSEDHLRRVIDDTGITPTPANDEPRTQVDPLTDIADVITAVGAAAAAVGTSSANRWTSPEAPRARRACITFSTATFTSQHRGALKHLIAQRYRRCEAYRLFSSAEGEG